MTYGEQFVACIRQYLTENKLTSLGHINAKILGELAQRFYEKWEEDKKLRRKNELEEEWVHELENDPDYVGVDIRKELRKAKEWCRKRNLKLVRKTFVESWIPNADREVVGDYRREGYLDSEERTKPERTDTTPYTPDMIVPGWPSIVRYQMDYPEAEMEEICSKDWHELPVELRLKIIAMI